MFANRKYEELSCPKKQKMCHPVLLKLRLLDSQSSRENASYATPQSCTSPALACYKEAPTILLPSTALLDVFIIRPLLVMRTAKRNLSKNTKLCHSNAILLTNARRIQRFPLCIEPAQNFPSPLTIL